MIRRACTAVWYCDACESRWSYGGANQDVCDDKAKRDGWATEKSEPLGIPVTRHVCPTCVRARR
jgi:hypothetical protein